MRASVEAVAIEAGHFIAQQFSLLKKEDIVTKVLNSLVSYVDIEAEKLITNKLTQLWPTAGFLTEEETVQQCQYSSDVWIVDPLDGTTNFIHELPFFGVSIALRRNNHYVLGVVFDVMQNKLFSAQAGGGGFLNGMPITVSDTEDLSQSVVATGFHYNSFEQLENYLNLFRELFQTTRGIRRFGSAALDLCYMASGSFAGFFEYG